jgi:hypothetical protein
MQRSVGIKVSAVIAITSAMSLARVTVLYMAVGIWGIVSAIGLLRLRNWARICVAIFGGLLAGFSLCVAIGLIFGLSLMPHEFPPGSVVSSGFITGLLSAFAMIALSIAGLGIWWVFYLNRKHVKIQFLGEDTASAPKQLPVSIAIIAWALIASGIMILPQLLAPTPTLFFSFVFHGSAARLIYFFIGSVSLVSGIGVLKRIPEGYSISVAFLCFSFANSLSSYLLPGSHTRRSNLIQELLGNQTVFFPMESYLTFVILIGLVSTGAGLWFFITRKQAFLHATAK